MRLLDRWPGPTGVLDVFNWYAEPMFEGFKTVDVDVDGIRIHARASGDGPPVLLLHISEGHV